MPRYFGISAPAYTLLESSPTAMPDDTYSASRDEEEKASVGGSTHVSTHVPVAETDQPEFLFETSNPFFVRDLEYTREEEARVIRILDTRLLPWVLLTT